MLAARKQGAESVRKSDQPGINTVASSAAADTRKRIKLDVMKGLALFCSIRRFAAEVSI